MKTEIRKNFHISHLVSRGFQLIMDKINSKFDLMSSSDNEKVRT